MYPDDRANIQKLSGTAAVNNIIMMAAVCGPFPGRIKSKSDPPDISE
jgi:hypothetical protein